jgi:GT2 family glycosyltransferase
MRASIVVPTHNRPELLARLLDALAKQEFEPSSFEVLICDDAASDATRQQVESFASDARPTARYLPNTGRRGPAAARNLGWRSARGAVIAFTDDDTVPDPGWLAAGLAALDEHDADAATGRVVVPIPDPPTDYERNVAGLATAEFVTANCFVRRSALERVGGFDERFARAWREDSDLHFALLRSGHKIIHAPDAVVVHPVRPAPWGVSLRQQRNTLFEPLLYKKYPDLYRARIRRSPPWDYYANVAALALAPLAAAAGHPGAALTSLAAWAILTARFGLRRLRGSSLEPAHVAEMAATSALIPALSVFWRLYGAWKFRVFYL